MRILVVLLLLIIIPFCGQSKSKYSRYKKPEFLKFSFGPEIGGMGYVAILKTNEAKFYGQYNLGGTIEIRPFRAVSLNTGLTYNKIINGASFYNTPLLLGIYREKMAFFGGPVLYAINNNGKLDFSNQKIGGAIGYGSASGGIFLFYNPNNPLSLDGISDIRFFIGVGLKLNLKIGFVSPGKFGMNY